VGYNFSQLLIDLYLFKIYMHMYIYIIFFWWCWVLNSGFMLARQGLYCLSHASAQYIHSFYYSFIHMCIHCLGLFSPFSPSLSPLSLPGRICSALISNFVEEKT
jgi:hypothetical protein